MHASTETPQQTAHEAIRGRLVFPGDAEWDAARQAFNLAVDQRPEAVAFPLDERDVAAVVGFARERGWRVAAQATGHNAAPLGPLDGTLVLNTSMLTGVRIDAQARRVRVGAATKWEAVVPQLSELGLAALHGSSPDVGIVGYSLGGGLGWLARSKGLQCNSVTAIELVTADGDLIRTDASHEPDLFWALRGGGGSFGVVTAIEFEVYPMAEVLAGGMFFPVERAGEVMRAWRDLLPYLPDELMSQVTLVHFPDFEHVPEPVRGRSFAIVLGVYDGEEREGRRVLAPLAELGPLMNTFAMVPPAALGELAMDPPDPLPYLSTHDVLGELPDETIDELVAATGADSGVIAFQLRHLGGALARAEDGAGSRATLDGGLAMFAVGAAPAPPVAAALQQSLDRIAAICRPQHAGLYASFVETPTDASAFYPAETWRRLREVKALYDPLDVFRGNHHIPPADGRG